MTLLNFTKNNITILDGATGTELQKTGLAPGEPPEMLNLSDPEAVRGVHLAYLRAGSNLILSNTFGVNSRRLRGGRPDELTRRGVDIAKSAAAGFGAYAALDIGPAGELMEPLGSMSFEYAYELFAAQIIAGAAAGADAVYIETMTDLAEARCALLAAKENCKLPVFCTMSFERGMRTFTGTSIASAALTLTGLGADFIGINCSAGPDEIRGMALEMMRWTDLPVIIKPNAGLPETVGGRTVYNLSPEDFAVKMRPVLELGAAVVGGCCGTTPEFIARLSETARGDLRVERPDCTRGAVCSSAAAVKLRAGLIAGERINPTNRAELRDALIGGDYEYAAEAAADQVDEGADLLDINVCTGSSRTDEAAVMAGVISSVQTAVSVPLMIDSVNPAAIEAGLRAYCGKAIVNSVNASRQSLGSILPIVKKYGAAVVGMTFDENGIPKTAEGRLAAAERIIAAAAEYGIPATDVIIDCLVMSGISGQSEAQTTIEALRLLKEKLGVTAVTILGVSNISYGMRERAEMNRKFLEEARSAGLDIAIMNTAGG